MSVQLHFCMEFVGFVLNLNFSSQGSIFLPSWFRAGVVVSLYRGQHSQNKSQIPDVLHIVSVVPWNARQDASS